MSFVATAIVGGAVIGGIASNKASKTAANSAAQANQTLDARYTQTRADELPFIEGGQNAQGKLATYLGTGGDPNDPNYNKLLTPFTADDYLTNKDPGYQFQLQQGSQAVQNAGAAGSGAVSGAALKDLMSFNQNYAKTGYQAAYDRWNTNMNNTFARLSTVATLGQNAAAQTGTQGVAIGMQQAANTTAAGNAGAAADVAFGNLAANAGTDYALYKTIKP